MTVFVLLCFASTTHWLSTKSWTDALVFKTAEDCVENMPKYRDLMKRAGYENIQIECHKRTLGGGLE